MVRIVDLLTSTSHPLCVSSCSLYHVIFRKVTDSYYCLVLARPFKLCSINTIILFDLQNKAQAFILHIKDNLEIFHFGSVLTVGSWGWTVNPVMVFQDHRGQLPTDNLGL